MSIAADNIAPAFHSRRSISLEDLPRLVDPVVIHEGERRDSDGEVFHVYTVAGWLDGQNVATIQGGATIGGQVIVIPMADRQAADMIAGLGLEDTINAQIAEEHALRQARAAQARLGMVNPVRRLELATAKEKNPEFEADSEAIRRLRGDDIVLAAGGVAH